MQTNSLDQERQKTAVKYEEIQRRMTIIEWVITGIILLILVFGGVSFQIARLLNFPQPLASLLYFIILGLAISIITAPINYYSGFILPHKYNLSVQKLTSWVLDLLKSGVIALIIGLLFVAFVYWTLEKFPMAWWILTGVFAVLISLLLTRLSSTLLISLFFKMEPLKDREMEERLKRLAEITGTSVNGVYTINLSAKGTTANAMLGGLGKTRRIILTDTLLQKYTAEEIEVILAHELGHHVLKHIPNLILVQVASTLLSLYLINLALVYGGGLLGYKYLADAAAFPFIILVLAVISLLLTPILNAYSRQLETNADKIAIQLTDNPAAFISMMSKLTDQNLSVARPKRWVEIMFYDHPPYSKRVELARKYIDSQNLEEKH